MKIYNSLARVITYSFCMSKNPYKTLGVNPDASEEEIKKAFREIAQKYHPDKNPDPKAKQLFVSAKQAYETLTDEDKRRQYDNEHTDKWSRNRGYGFDKNPFDQFSDDIFKDKSRVHHQTHTSGSTRRKKGEDIKKQISISFEEAVHGTKVKLSFERKDTCKTCNGNRCKPGTAPTRCLSCGGSGTTVYRQGSIVMHLECERCHGIGLIIKHPCLDCKGTGININKSEETFEIPEGIQSNNTLTFRGKGNQSQHGPSGDFLLKVKVDRHPRFRRNGYNIETTEWLTVSQAALGIKKDIQTIKGKKTINIQPGTQDGTKIKLKGEGIHKGFEQGDHVCLIRVKIPTKLSAEQKQIFLELAKTQNRDDINFQNLHEEQNEEENEKSDKFKRFRDYFK